MNRRNESTNENINVNHYINILQAYSNGEEIEHRIKGSKDAWTSCSNLTFDFNHIEYRVKSKPVYRPYISGNEAFVEIHERTPSGWLYNTETRLYEQVLCIGDNGIYTRDNDYSYKQAFDTFIYPNDEKFGIKLDEED